jgi:hypothetical protein
MKTNKFTQPMIQTSAMVREADGYAINSGSFKNWSPCVEHTKYEAFEGWDG